MISAMLALKKKRNILLEFCEVFINDPLIDWVKLTKDKKMGIYLHLYLLNFLLLRNIGI